MTQRLLLISPVRNEEAHIETVAAAVAAQTRPPDLWVIADDGSTDRTPEILSWLAARIGFLQVLAPAPRPRAGAVRDRLATASEAVAFNRALNNVEWRSFTHIAKLDGDTELPADYFERILSEFERDERLGLAGGVYADPDGEGWKVVPIPPDHHVPGTLKCYSLPCLEAIGGVQERLGWDTIDETYARMRGFRTRAFAELVAHHHRPWGTADGVLRGRARHGQCAYIVHFPLHWVALRAVKLARARPVGLSGLAFLYGYVRSFFRRVPRVDDPAFRSFVRHELHDRVRGELTQRLTRGPRTVVIALAGRRR